MFNLRNRIYLATFINTFGSWLTFLAIALLAKEKYGAQQVALVFLIQTLPAIIFSRSLSQLVRPDKLESVYWKLQVALAGCSLLLVFNQSLLAIYVHLFLSSLFKSVSNPLMNTLIGKWTEKDQQTETFTRVGALQAGTLALAPALGAWIKIATSAEFLFALDALTFVLSIVLLKELFKVKSPIEPIAASEKATFNFKLLLAGVSRMPKDTPQSIRNALLSWFLFLTVGALLNAIEFAGFERIHMSEREIGYAMTAWGVGNLVAFLLKVPVKSKSALILAYALSLALFVGSWHSLATLVSFFAAALFSSYLSGELRAGLHGSVPAGYNPLPVWAYANQITQVINLVAYATVGALLYQLGFYLFGVLMILSLVLMLKANQISSLLVSRTST